MSPRQKRIEKVVTHRGKELDKRVAELNAQKQRELEAKRMAEAEREELLRASESRLKLAEATISATSWIEANEWLKTRAAKSELAETQAIRAKASTQRARAEVLNARADLKKLEVLSERIGTEERSREERVARRLEDEIAALRFAADRGNGQK